MSRSEIHKNFHFYLSCALAFLMSFKFFIPVLIALLFVNWLAQGNFKTRWNSVSNKVIVFLFISIYILYLAGMFYSTDTAYGWSDLQTKLSLLIFPLLFSFTVFTVTDFKKIIACFIAGVVGASLLLLFRASYFYFSQHLNYFFYVNFLHPSYFGMYVNMALLFILEEAIPDNAFRGYLKIILVLFLFLIIVLLSSKLALISTLLIFIFHGVNHIILTKKYKTGILLTMTFFASLFILVKSVPELDARIQNVVTILQSEKIDKTDSESNAVRILVWNAATDALFENGLFGVGTGDVKTELFKNYTRLGYTGALEHKLNAHNQFLQTGVALGLLGLLLLVVSILYPLFISLRQKNYLFVSFSLLIVINYLTEAMLEAESGVIFIAFFQSLLFYNRSASIAHV